MREDVALHLNDIVKALDRDIEATAGYGLHVTASLLRMARLDLLSQIHGISDEELEGFSDALIEKTSIRDHAVLCFNSRKRRDISERA
jgi:hypothetical protein